MVATRQSVWSGRLFAGETPAHTALLERYRSSSNVHILACLTAGSRTHSGAHGSHCPRAAKIATFDSCSQPVIAVYVAPANGSQACHIQVLPISNWMFPGRTFQSYSRSPDWPTGTLQYCIKQRAPGGRVVRKILGLMDPRKKILDWPGHTTAA